MKNRILYTEPKMDIVEWILGDVICTSQNQPILDEDEEYGEIEWL